MTFNWWKQPYDIQCCGRQSTAGVIRLLQMKPAEGIYTTSEMPKVFTLHSVRVFTPKENKWGIYTML